MDTPQVDIRLGDWFTGAPGHHRIDQIGYGCGTMGPSIIPELGLKLPKRMYLNVLLE